MTPPRSQKPKGARPKAGDVPGSCIVCENGPMVIAETEMCGPCTFGEHDAEPLPLYPCDKFGRPLLPTKGAKR